MDTVEAAPSRRRAHGWVVLAAATAVVVALAVAWLLTAPNDIGTPGGTIGLSANGAESVYIGYYPLAERDLVLQSVEPVNPDGLDVSLWLCRAVPGESPIGTANDEHLPEYCRTVEPFVSGTTVAGHGGGWDEVGSYLLVEVAATSDQPQVLCGLDITYRRVGGWRTGRQRTSGPYEVVMNDPMEDEEDEWDEHDPLSACGSR